jgi:hypothetical protein
MLRVVGGEFHHVVRNVDLSVRALAFLPATIGQESADTRYMAVAMADLVILTDFVAGQDVLWMVLGSFGQELRNFHESERSQRGYLYTSERTVAEHGVNEGWVMKFHLLYLLSSYSWMK